MAITGTDVRLAATLLEKDLVAIPTETVYGLAANAFDPHLVAKIFTVKQRPSFDPLIVHTWSAAQLEQFVLTVPGQLLKLAEACWPGPLTLLLPKSDRIPGIVTSGLPDVAVRIPAHPLTLELLRLLDFPLAAPSANPFGYISPTTAAHVERQLGDKIPYILDGGPCSVGVESTIVGMENGAVTLYRLGGIPLEEITAITGPVNLKLNQSSDPRAPGMLKSHYAPRKPLLLGQLDQLLEAHKEQQPLLICFSRFITGYPQERQFLLSPSGDPDEAAVNLFSVLHRADEHPAPLILAEPVPDGGLGRAVNDRLQRAAGRSFDTR